MFLRLWRRVGGIPARTYAPPSRRPTLDPLDDRLLPSALLPGAPAGECAATMIRHANRATDGYRTTVTVAQNAPPTVLNLVEILSGLGVEDAADRSLYVVGNTNPGLVRARLADDELTLTYSAGQHGKAVITVEAIDAAGESVRLTIEVTVTPAP